MQVNNRVTANSIFVDHRRCVGTFRIGTVIKPSIGRAGNHSVDAERRAQDGQVQSHRRITTFRIGVVECGGLSTFGIGYAIYPCV